MARFAVSLVTLIVLVLGTEVAHRYRYYGMAGFSPRMLASVRTVGDAGIVQASDCPNIVYELKPNLDGIFKLAPFRTNSHGMRDAEVPREKPEGTLRIAAVGDSFTMGSGVAEEDVYHSVLERRLNARFPDRRVEILNFGVGGYGLLDYVAVLEDKAFDFDPDLILVGLVVNDATPPDAEHTKENFRERVGRERSFLRLVFVQHLIERIDAAPAKPEDPAGEREAAKAYRKRCFERLGKAARGVPVVCIHLATSASERELRNARRFRRLATAQGFEFVDTTELFDGRDSSSHRIFPNDPHPDAEIHARYAGLLEEFLAERL